MLASRAVGGAHGEATQNKRIEKEDWAGGGKKIKGVKKGWREKEKEIIKKRKLILFFI